MRKLIGIGLPALALLAAVGCGSSDSKDTCAKACDKLVACAETLDTTVGYLVGHEDATPENCAAGCREELQGCLDLPALQDCIDPLTCPAPGAGAADTVKAEVAGCFAHCQPVPPS